MCNLVLCVALLLVTVPLGRGMIDAELSELFAKAKAMGRSTEVWEVEDWNIKEELRTHHLYGKVNVTTFTSPVIKLIAGGAHFTWPPLTKMPFPSGDYTLLSAAFQITDHDGSIQTPLSEVYNHHWLIGNQFDLNPLHACEWNLFFGAGAEMRGVPIIFPDGYGMQRIDAGGWCGGNLHFIRTEDLANNWTGMNDPNGNHHAAVKNCIECGFAPHRAIECLEPLDGDFACCYTGSRCPVNHPQDKGEKEYHLVYEVHWTRVMNATKGLQGGVLDVSGGQIEWNVAPNLNNPSANQVCDDTVCNITDTFTVGFEKAFGEGICAGTMMWGYLHQHIGAINGTLKLNGKTICTSKPIYGTDPKNPAGNEKGYIVNFTRCIDKDNLHNPLRVEEGDNLTVTALYDVDVHSTRASPFPGGKHGGVMGLYFFMMECDPETMNAEYVCRQSTCIAVGAERPIKNKFKTLGDCLEECK